MDSKSMNKNMNKTNNGLTKPVTTITLFEESEVSYGPGFLFQPGNGQSHDMMIPRLLTEFNSSKPLQSHCLQRTLVDVADSERHGVIVKYLQSGEVSFHSQDGSGGWPDFDLY